MIIVMKPSALPQDVDKIVDAVEKEGLKTNIKTELRQLKKNLRK